MRLLTAFRTIVFATALVVLSIAASAQNFNHQGVTLTAPVTLTPGEPIAGTTTSGLSYTETLYTGTLPNTDIFMVGIGEFRNNIETTSLSTFADAFVAGTGGKADKSFALTVSGLPALATSIDVPDGDRTIRMGWIGVVKGNRAYQFVFGSYTDVKSDNDGIENFFRSITIN